MRSTAYEKLLPPLVAKVCEEVALWREAGYAGASATSRALLWTCWPSSSRWVCFGRDGDVPVILLAGGTKKRQQRDIETAKLRWADYKRRKRLL